MTWTDVGEILKVLGAVATACAAWFAATTAYRGLGKWRSETLGKRRADLAATVLAAAYRMEEIFREARSPWVMVHETTKRSGVPDAVAEKADYAPEARLQAHEEFFGRFRTLRHEYAAVFGPEAAKALDELWRIRININHAVFFMLDDNNKELRKGDAEDKQLWHEQYYTAFRHHKEEEDAVLKQIKEAIVRVEAVCRPAVEAREKDKSA